MKHTDGNYEECIPATIHTLAIKTPTKKTGTSSHGRIRFAGFQRHTMCNANSKGTPPSRMT